MCLRKFQIHIKERHKGEEEGGQKTIIEHVNFSTVHSTIYGTITMKPPCTITVC
jgi:hypothetical protein